MTRTNSAVVIMMLLIMVFTGCKKTGGGSSFDEFNRTVQLDNWQFALNVENLSKKIPVSGAGADNHYLKVTLYLSNSKTRNSMLYSISKDVDDYEAKYKYLSFGAREDLYIKHKDELIYPIGYVFEPSNGLSNSEKMVYKFQISDKVYKDLQQDNDAVEYWYIDRLAGLGKICFKQQ